MSPSNYPKVGCVGVGVGVGCVGGWGVWGGGWGGRNDIMFPHEAEAQESYVKNMICTHQATRPLPFGLKS